jgi:hypothetical protein
MRRIKYYLVLILSLSFVLSAADLKKHKHKRSELLNTFDKFEINVEDNDIVFTSKEEPAEEVIFTSENGLIINGEKIPLNQREKQRVRLYREQTFLIIDKACDIGIQGGKLGAQGAMIGLEALAGVFKMIDDDYDSEDLERELEARAEELELEAEKLEHEAEEIEEMAEELEEMQHELKEEIEELDDLHWFSD